MKKRKRGLGKYVIIILIAVILFLGAGLLLWYKGVHFLPCKTYSAEDFQITVIKSGADYDADGTDDYTDILLGARRDAENCPKYDGGYYEGGYPPENIGVCTDVIWRSFKNAGYSLRDMVDSDILENPEDYPDADPPDSNIDFRRVRNLKVFFEKYAENLTLDPQDIEQWQPGDIVTFEDRHIGIVSDKRNAEGVAYIIHNGGQPNRDEDYLSRTNMEISGHFRFNAEEIPAEILRSWKD